jgi:Zn-dependent metalloprotease
MKRSFHFNPLHCIIPPYMVDKLMESGNQKIADLAINSNFRTFRLQNDRRYFQKATPQMKLVLGARTVLPVSNVMQMKVFDCRHKTNPAGAKLLWDSKTNKKISSLAANNVIRGGKASWDFYFQLFGRNSIDNNGLLISQYIHFDRGYENAFWDGRRMIYGDGDGIIFSSFTSDIDIIAHELTHGVMENEANLEYENQAGALNESFSDVFGIMIKQKYLNQDVKKSNWLIGEKVMKGANHALRSICQPGTGYINHPDLGDDPQPASMDNYQQLPNTKAGDWGGVHINSGIPNFAFYVAAYDMGGFSWEKAGKIWYAALTDNTLQQDAKFTDMKNLTIMHAERIFGITSSEAGAVKNGWAKAKV